MKEPTIKQRKRSYKALLKIAKQLNDTESVKHYEQLLKLLDVAKLIEEEFI